MNKLELKGKYINKFQSRIDIKSNKNSEKYNRDYVIELYLRYMQKVKQNVDEQLWNKQNNISPMWVINLLDKHFKKSYKLKWVSISYKTYRDILMNISSINQSYNTEDWQIRWLVDNDIDVNLWSFHNILPLEIIKKMTKWHVMHFPLQLAIEMRWKIESIDESYNTEDGQIRWLQDNHYEVNLGNFYTIVPKSIKLKMNNWYAMSHPFKQTIELREKLETIDESYNTDDGQIRWLQDNKLNINLGSFFSIVPKNIKEKMYMWFKMDLPLKNAITIRNKLENIDESYNTEDWQIRWLEDNNIDMHLWSFLTIVQQKIKQKMTKWQKMDLALQTTIEIRKKLKCIDESYNTEDWQIRWLQDNDYNINLWKFYTILPDKLISEMTNWHFMRLDLSLTIEIREKLEWIDESYNTEDWQIRWLQDNDYDIHLWKFYSILSNELKEKMSTWTNMIGPLILSEEIRKKLEKIDESYNTEDGQIRWLEDNNYNMNLKNFYTIIPAIIKEKMTNWRKISLNFRLCVRLRDKLEKIDESYNTEDGQIRWLEDNNYNIHLWGFYSIQSEELKAKMSSWTFMNMPLKKSMILIKKLEKIDESYNTEDGQIRWLQDNWYKTDLWNFFTIIPSIIKSRMTNWKQILWSLSLAVELRSKLSEMDQSYNTRHGHIQWMYDNWVDINMRTFNSIVPKKVKKEMQEWEFNNSPFNQALELLKNVA